MVGFIFKVLLTSVVVVAVAELGKRVSLFGAILASLPLTSILALSLLHLETRETAKTTALATGIFWMVVPSLAFFPLFVWATKHLPFWSALLAACAVTAVIYALYVLLLGRFGVDLR